MLGAFIMALGMFTIIPLRSWRDEHKSLIISCLPVVGLVIGCLWFGIGTLLFRVNSNVTTVLLTALLPLLLSGFIHLDGLMDICDAVFSRRDRETRLKILKDPHTGAFGVVSAVILVSLNAAGVYDAHGNYAALIFIPIMSRAVAGLALLRLKAISDTGYGAMFKAGTHVTHCIFIVLCAVTCIASAVYFNATLPVIACAFSGILTAAYFYKQLGGVSGDVCGAVICVSEAMGIIAIGGLG